MLFIALNTEDIWSSITGVVNVSVYSEEHNKSDVRQQQYIIEQL